MQESNLHYCSFVRFISSGLLVHGNKMAYRRKAPLNIAFIWNMHQPFYKDLATTEYMLPWVRLHGIKDYYGMVHILREFPDIHQTFNLVPSLLKQIQDYTQLGLKNINETSLQLTIKPASELTREDKVYLLYNFFMTNWHHMVHPYTRYAELLTKRGTNVSIKELNEIQAYFSTQDYLDLQIWGNLTWIDPYFRNDPRIKELFEKGAGFSEQDKQMLLEVQEEILNLIVPEYHDLAKSGQVELITSPMYHPILPLLCDSNDALVALPDIPMPKTRFLRPEDALSQLNKGIATFKEITGITPRGMWPSEGSVSEKAVPLIAKAGIKWIATDEQILAKSLGVSLERGPGDLLKDPTILYQPYLIDIKGVKLNIVFRDFVLSDLVGFVYSRKDSRSAADDLIHRLVNINENLPSHGNHLVNIILDGENAWEYYENNGRDFLYFLYEGITNHPQLQAVTVSEYLKKHPAKKVLKKVFPGSWIYHNFKVWIGHEEDNSAWDQISMTIEALVNFEKDNPDADPELIARAWEEIYIAEGSDWFWWYGEEHHSDNDEMFDNLFRKQLINVYNMLGMNVPERLYISNIIEDKRCLPDTEPMGFINPTIDGKTTSYFEWMAAGSFNLKKYSGSMHQAIDLDTQIVTEFSFGFNLENLFLKIEFCNSWLEDNLEWSFIINFLQTHEMRLEAAKKPSKGLHVSLYKKTKKNEWKAVKNQADASLDNLLEIKLPFVDLEAKSGEELQLTISIEKEGVEMERWPGRGFMVIAVPGKNYEANLWRV